MINQRAIPLWLTAFGAVFFLGLGLWAFFDASSFYDEIADFPPYNAHFLHDISAFHAGLGAVLLLALLFPRDAIVVALGGVGFGATLHFVAHMRDHNLGGTDTDTALLGILGVLMLLATAWRMATGVRETGGFR